MCRRVCGDVCNRRMFFAGSCLAEASDRWKSRLRYHIQYVCLSVSSWTHPFRLSSVSLFRKNRVSFTSSCRPTVQMLWIFSIRHRRVLQKIAPVTVKNADPSQKSWRRCFWSLLRHADALAPAECCVMCFSPLMERWSSCAWNRPLLQNCLFSCNEFSMLKLIRRSAETRWWTVPPHRRVCRDNLSLLVLG